MSHAYGPLIAADADFDGSPLLRGEFVLDTGHGRVVSATLAYTAFGVVEAWVNGQPASENVLVPGWSSFASRVRVAEIDVTSLVAVSEHTGSVVLGLALGNGWYRGRLGWAGDAAFYGDELAASARLLIRFIDGHEQVATTDETWSAGPSATTRNDLYDGQDIDARRRVDGWSAGGFAAPATWTGVHCVPVDAGVLEPYIGPQVRRQEVIAPLSVWTSPAGRVLIDFGQNLVGWVRVRVRGERGSVLTLRHAEVLEHDELSTRPLRTAKATDRFTFSGGDDVFEPTFTFHGFRYVEIDGWPGGIAALKDGCGLEAVVVHSQMRRIGRFSSSHEGLNRLHENAVWGMKGNFVDVPTDCPQRDERLGWTGDIAAFAPSAAFLFDVDDFLRDWLRDLAVEQAAHGGVVPVIVPDVLARISDPADLPGADPTAVWGDSAVWVPWALWQAYGDKRVLADQFDSMLSHVRGIRDALSAEGLWNTGKQFGDWLDPTAPPGNPAAAKADPDVVATICGYRSARLVADSARLLGRAAEAVEADDLAACLRAAFTEHYLDEGRIRSDAATVYALAIEFGILSESDRKAAGGRLAELVRASGHRISTGFAGTPFVTDALADTGHLDDAYRLLLQTENPSWLYPVSMGATTIWERWDSMLPDGTINPGEMTSFNHYALGAVVDWMHRTVAGLAPLSPGYDRILFAPQPGGDLTHAEASLDTPHGRAAIRWDRDGDEITVVVTVPDAAEAVLRLTGRPDEPLGGGVHTRTAPIPAPEGALIGGN